MLTRVLVVSALGWVLGCDASRGPLSAAPDARAANPAPVATGLRAPEPSAAGSGSSPEALPPADNDQPLIAAAQLESSAAVPLRAADPISVSAMSWQYVAFPHAVCMDGRSTGLGINLNPSSDRVLIYIDEGNSIALTALTALITPRSWGPADLNRKPTGVLDRSDRSNPFRDWNLVYIPACAGDMNTGATARGYDGAPQLGSLNFGEYLSRLVPTFARSTRVVLSGSSTGAFGAAFNWARTQDAFGDIPVDLLSDSGLPLGPDYIPNCALKLAGDMWNWRASLHPACSECDVRTGAVMSPLLHATLRHVGPASRAAFLSYDEDATMKTFFALGQDDCKHLEELIPPAYPTGKFPAGIANLRAEVADHPNVAFFVVRGESHTFLHDTLSASANGVQLTDWLRAFAQGDPDWKSVVP